MGHGIVDLPGPRGPPGPPVVGRQDAAVSSSAVSFTVTTEPAMTTSVAEARDFQGPPRVPGIPVPGSAEVARLATTKMVVFCDEWMINDGFMMVNDGFCHSELVMIDG